MTRVLFLLTKDDVGGAQKYVHDIAQHLNKERFHAEVLTGGKDVPHLSNAFRPHLLFIDDWKALLELRRVFKEKQPDIVHLNNSKAGVIGAIAAKLASKHIKVVFTAHGWVFQPGSPISALRRWFYKLLHKIASRFQDIIITVSEYDFILALEHGIAPERKLVMIHNGINIEQMEFFEKSESRKNILAHTKNRTQAQYWIGSIGRLVKEKHYEALIDAAAHVGTKDIHFFIVGEGPERSSLEARIASLGLADQFTLLGAIKNASRYLRAFDVFVLPSVKEGLPYTILEAMAAEVPIIATGAGGLLELLEGRGRTVGNSEGMEIAQAIDTLLKNANKAQRLTHQAHEYVRTHLSLAVMIRETEKVYETITKH